MADAAQQQRQQGQNGHLRGEALGRGDADLRAGVHVDAAIVLAGDGAGDVVADAQGPVALALALAQCGQRIGGLAALADDKDQRVLVHRHVAVAEFARELDLYGDVRQRFDHVLADHRRVQRRPAPGQHDAVHIAQLRRRHLQPP